MRQTASSEAGRTYFIKFGNCDMICNVPHTIFKCKRRVFQMYWKVAAKHLWITMTTSVATAANASQSMKSSDERTEHATHELETLWKPRSHSAHSGPR